MKSVLEKLSRQAGDVTAEDISHAVSLIMEGKATTAQIGAFLMGLKMYGEQPFMVAACTKVMREHSLKCPLEDVTDIVGTGGDGHDTFNVSTAAAIVAAACGLRVAKHGNRASSSACGSADILEAAGAKLDLDPPEVKEIVDACGFCFLFSQRFHPAMKHVAPARKEIGVRTMFNMVGPLTNPASPATSVIGTNSAATAELAVETLRLQGMRRAMVVCGDRGLDEISPEGPTRIWVLKDGEISNSTITPGDFGVEVRPLESVRGGDPQVNLEILKDLLNNKPGPYLDWVVMNTAALLVVNQKAENYRDGVDLARHAVSSGKARHVLEQFTMMSASFHHKKHKSH